MEAPRNLQWYWCLMGCLSLYRERVVQPSALSTQYFPWTTNGVKPILLAL